MNDINYVKLMKTDVVLVTAKRQENEQPNSIFRSTD